MRIVHISDYFQPGVGYQEYYLAVCQAAAGHDVSVVTSDRYMPFPDYARTVESILGPRIVGPGVSALEGITVHRLPCRFEYRRNALWLEGLEAVLAKLKPDVLNVDDVFTVTAGRIARMNRRLGLPLVFDNHAADYNTAIQPSLRYRLSLAAFRAWAIPTIRAEADVLIAIDEGTRNMLCREIDIPAAGIPIIPLGADAYVFRPDPTARAAFRARFRLEGKFVIVFAGKLLPGKGVHMLLEAVEAASGGSTCPLHLLVIGNGPSEYVATLDAMAGRAGLRDRVTFIRHFLEREKLNEALNAADVGVWPMEPSNVIQEATAAGLPVIVPHSTAQGLSNAGYVKYDNGLTFERSNVGSLAAAVLRLASDANMRARMARRARELVDNEWSWTAIAERFVAEFARAIDIRIQRRIGRSAPYLRRRSPSRKHKARLRW